MRKIDSVFLGVVSDDSYRTGQFKHDLENEVPPAVNNSTGSQFHLRGIDVQYDDPIPFQQPQHIVLTVAMPPRADPPNLASRIERRVDTRIRSALDLPVTGPLIEGKRVDVEVRYVVRQG